MARYSGNLLRLAAPQQPKIAPGEPDPAHNQPSGPDEVPGYYAEQIDVPGDTGLDYSGTVMDDGYVYAVVAGQPSLGWNAPETASEPVGSGKTPAGEHPDWTRGDPHNAAVDTSWIHNRGATPLPNNHNGNDTAPYSYVGPIVGVEGTRFLEREVDFPKQVWAEPTGAGVDKFIAGTNSYAANNPEGDQYTYRGQARVHYGFEGNWFVHTPMFQDKPAQTYELQRPPITATEPLVGGAYSNTPMMGQLASNTWLTELGESTVPSGYGVAVDGVM